MSKYQLEADGKALCVDCGCYVHTNYLDRHGLSCYPNHSQASPSEPKEDKRLKVAKILAKRYFPHSEWYDLRNESQQCYLELADQIIAALEGDRG